MFRALAGSGVPLLMESPGYWGAILAAAQAGGQIVPVPSGPGGPDIAELDRAFGETGARLFYAQPNDAHPTGARWPVRMSEQVLDVVRAHGAFLVEDDWAHDFGLTSEVTPLAGRDDSGHVVYLRPRTRSVSPGIGVAAVVARGPARDGRPTCAASGTSSNYAGPNPAPFPKGHASSARHWNATAKRGTGGNLEI